MAGLIPLATDTTNGLMEASTIKTRYKKFYNKADNLLKVAEIKAYYQREVINIIGSNSSQINTMTILCYSESDISLKVAFSNYKQQSSKLKFYKKDNSFYIYPGNGALPFSGYIMSTSGVEETDLTIDDSYTEVKFS